MIPVLVLCFYLVVEVLRPEVLFADPESRILLWSGIALLASWLVDKFTLGKPWRYFPSTPFMLGLLVVGAASSTVASLRGYSNPSDKFTDLAKAVFVSLIAAQILDTVRRLNLVRWVLTVTITVLAVGGILFTYGYEIPAFNYDPTGRLQYTGIYQDSNDLAMLYLVPFGMLLFGMFNSTGVSRKLFFAAAAVPSTWAIILTASRGAMLGAGIAVFLAIRRRCGLLAPALIALTLLIAMNRFGVARMDTFAADEESAEGRIRSWSQGWYMLRSNPLLGVGPRNYTAEHPVAPHNTVVQVTAEMGLAGLFCWVGFFYFPLQEFAKPSGLRMAGSSRPALVLQQLQAALLPTFVASLFLSRAYTTIPYLLAAMVTVARDAIPEEDTEIVYSARVSFAALSVLVLGILVAWRFVAREFINGL